MREVGRGGGERQKAASRRKLPFPQGAMWVRDGQAPELRREYGPRAGAWLLGLGPSLL